MHKWYCDGCGKRTFMVPKTEPVYEERDVEVDAVEMVEEESFDPSDPKTKVKVQVPRKVRRAVKHRVPKTTKMKRQNAETGKVEDVEVPEFKDLEPRTYIVALRAGSERIQRNFCKGCLKTVRSELQALWTKLEGAAKEEGSDADARA